MISKFGYRPLALQNHNFNAGLANLCIGVALVA